MDTAHRSSPGAMSPYQHAMKANTMAQPSNYPSPARSDSETSKYPADSLGLYNYSMSLATSGPAPVYPPSPQPTEAWTHLSTAASPLMTEAPSDPWPAVYDHPISRSPLPWNSGLPFPHSRFGDNRHSPDVVAHTSVSHRPTQSTSSQAMSMYSREGTEATYSSVKLETGSGWTTEEEASPGHRLSDPPMTVAPERLSASMFAYSNAYNTPPMPRFDSATEDGQDTASYSSLSYDGRRRSPSYRESSAAATHRTRIRRNPTTPENANFKCEVCGKLFQRSYNHKTHMEIHDPAREFPNPCLYPHCNKKFVRRTDLVRHEKSVHVKAKDFQCRACEARFARKDTLRRHEEDGCPKRNELRDGRLPARPDSLKSGGPSRLGYHAHVAGGSCSSQSPPLHASGLYRESGYSAHPGAY